MAFSISHNFSLNTGVIVITFICCYNNRDRAPFVLTSDMAYVINGGDTPTTSFQKFTDLCCTAYNELRKNSNLFINLLELVSHNYCNKDIL